MSHLWLDCLNRWDKTLSHEVWRFNCFPFYDADASHLPASLVGLDEAWRQQNQALYRKIQHWWFEEQDLQHGAVDEFDQERFRFVLLPHKALQRLFLWGAAGYYHETFLKVITHSQREALFREIDEDMYLFATKRVNTSINRRPAPELFIVEDGENMRERLEATVRHLAAACFSGASQGFWRRLTLKMPRQCKPDEGFELDAQERLHLQRYLKELLSREIEPSCTALFT